jgi:hypothetical protein
VGPRTHIPALLGALALTALAACDSWVASTNTIPGDPAGGGSAVMAGKTLLESNVGALTRIPLQGVRKVEARWTEGAVQHALVYRERITGDGTGRFDLQLLELIEPPLPPNQANQFTLLHESREGLFFRYRDFEIRDFDLFSANFSAVSSKDVAQVAGRQVERWVVQRRAGAERRYVVDLDAENGIALRAREELLDGTLVSQLEYESLDLAPDLTNVPFHQKSNGEIALTTSSFGLARGLGFSPHQPRHLPRGYSLHEAAKLVDAKDGRTWAKLVYSDGVDLMFFVEAEPKPPSPHVQPGSTQTLGTLRSLRVGLWTVLQAEYLDRDSIAMGKQGELALSDAIRSAYP